MEDQASLPGFTRAPGQALVELAGADVEATPNERNATTRVGNAESSPSQPSQTDQGGPQSAQIINFRNHLGDLYIWPFERCPSFEAIKPLLEEAYTLLKSQECVDKIKEGRYDIRTDDNEIILPSVWTSLVTPSQTIQIHFWPQDGTQQFMECQSPPRRQRSSSPDWYGERRTHVEERSRARRADIQEVTVDVDVSQSPPASNASLSQTDDSEDSQEDGSLSSPGEGDEVAPALRQPDRVVVPPVDADGNTLSFGKDTTHLRNSLSPTHSTDHERGPKMPDSRSEPADMHVDTLRITKAVLTGIESKSIIQIHTLPGLEHAHFRKDVSTTWYHIHAAPMDFARFKKACLNVSSLSEPQRAVVSELLKRVETEKIEVFLDGMFIEPGTVLRVDEQGQIDPFSVIFSCIPYFDLEIPPKKSTTGPSDRLFPPRSLMQSYYPYEPVRERDAEQAYKKFGNDRSGRLVQVPNIWMMNIGSDAIVTSGHRPMSEDMIKSIAIVEENPRKLGTKVAPKDSSADIRLTNFDGRVLIYPLDSCRTYFELEQKVHELRYTTSERADIKGLQLDLVQAGNRKEITPKSWATILRENDCIFIHITVRKDDGSVRPTQGRNKAYVPTLPTNVIVGSAPPFFHWPRSLLKNTTTEENKIQCNVPTEPERSIDCLEEAEKNMLSKTLLDWETLNAVDKTFTSTNFYQSLPDNTYEGVRNDYAFPGHTAPDMAPAGSRPSYHQHVVQRQCYDIKMHSAIFLDVVRKTLGLFVVDVNRSTMLRKLWGAMANIQQRVSIIEQRGAIQPHMEEHTTPSQRPRFIPERAWLIRSASKDALVPGPDADKTFTTTLRRCRRCKSDVPYGSPEAALEHLQNHIMSIEPTEHNDTADLKPKLTTLPSPQATHGGQDLNDWIVSSSELKRERVNAGTLAILKEACESASQLLTQAAELVEGVQNEDGKISDMYTLPPRLVEAFRQVVVFYLAIERALHFTEESYQNDNSLEQRSLEISLPFSDEGLNVLKKFAIDVRVSLRIARHQLCYMVRSDPPMDILKQLSLSSQYTCAWLMRRLIVKPLDKRMTVGDMYREYLSTIQFQVNHRPGKRLLRDINLLQEELNVLLTVNSWQIKLVENYMSVLDDSSYEKDIPFRRAMFPYEQTLLQSCLDNLAVASEEYTDLIRRCSPLSDRTKQSLEINEEDHGKAIMVFTIVTVIFLPLSFVTSYLGMNTIDIRDMGSSQSLFYIIAIPLTIVTIGACLLIGYNGDELRDIVSSFYRTLTGREERQLSARGVSVAQRKRAPQLQSDSNSSVDYTSLADEAEFATPRPDYWVIGYNGRTTNLPYSPDLWHTETETWAIDAEPPTLRTELRTEAPRTRLQEQTYSSGLLRTQPVTVNETLRTPMAKTTFTDYLYPSRHHRAGYERYNRGYGRAGYRGRVHVTGEEDEWYTRQRNPRRTEYTEYATPAPPRVVRMSSAHVADDDEDEGGYTWQKKRSHRHVRRDTERRPTRRSDV